VPIARLAAQRLSQTPPSDRTKDGTVRCQRSSTTTSLTIVTLAPIDVAAEDPRHELAFQAQLTDFSHQLRQEGGSATTVWTPGAARPEWIA
jgi:hypothetical protein